MLTQTILDKVGFRQCYEDQLLIKHNGYIYYYGILYGYI